MSINRKLNNGFYDEILRIFKKEIEELLEGYTNIEMINLYLLNSSDQKRINIIQNVCKFHNDVQIIQAMVTVGRLITGKFWEI